LRLNSTLILAAGGWLLATSQTTLTVSSIVIGNNAFRLAENISTLKRFSPASS
jgi:hypothetical protein